MEKISPGFLDIQPPKSDDGLNGRVYISDDKNSVEIAVVNYVFHCDFFILLEGC